MNFLFFDDTGESLTGAKFESLSSDLENNLEITIQAQTVGSEALVRPVIFLTPSSSLGKVDFPSKYPPHTDHNDLLLWGSNTESIAGLYYKKADASKVYFSLSAGANYLNGIPLEGFSSESSGSQILSITLGFTPKPASEQTRRLYTGVEVYDSGTNI
jgi:hypothetical protein